MMKDEKIITIKIKSTSSSDLTLPITTTSSVEELKESIRTALGQSSRGRYLRLIHGGRLLAPDHAPIQDFRLKDGSVIHAVVAAAGVRGGHQASLSRPNQHRRRRRLRGVGIGADGLILSRRSNGDGDGDGDGEGNSDEEHGDVEHGAERAGFDRLRAEGLSSSEVSALRIYFSRQVDQFTQQRSLLAESTPDSSTGNPAGAGTGSGSGTRRGSGESDTEDDDDDPEASSRARRMAMEDEWMETQGPHSEFRLNLNANNPLMSRRMYQFNNRSSGSMDPMYNGPLGTDRDFVWGFLLGYFVGFMMMFWVWLPTLPHRQKLGILTGLCFHLGMNLLDGTNDGLT